MGQPYLNTRAVADRIGLADSAVRRIPPEQLPYLAVGRRGVRRFRRIDVEDYVSSRRAEDRAAAERLVAACRPYRRMLTGASDPHAR